MMQEKRKTGRISLNYLKRYLVAFAILGAPWCARAAELETQSDFVPTSDGNSTEEAAILDFSVLLDLQCFGTNLRAVQNPLDPAATLTFTGNVAWLNQDRVFTVSFPAYIFFGRSLAASSVVVTNVSNIPSASSHEITNEGRRKKILVKLGGLTLPESAVSGAVGATPQMTGHSVYQSVPIARGRYYGYSGPLSATYTVRPGTGRQLVVTVRAPGQEGFCGGYHSPLMVFFDDKMPRFSGKSRFPLDNYYLQTFTWVEPNAPGYFLAVDRDKDGRINDAEELFGSLAKPNGFERLSAEDGNRDGVIDARDAIFSKLLLWSDKNGDGHSQPGELIAMSEKRVTSISLKYDEKDGRTWDTGAEFRQSSRFTFLDAKGQERKGKVIDVWFQSHGQLELAQRPVQKVGPAPYDLPLPPHMYRGPAWLPN